MKRQYHYYKESFLILIGIFIVSAVKSCGAEESITLTTYYPSPYGVYNEMRMYPHSPATVDCIPGSESQAEGTLYYDSAQDRLKVCGGDPLDWQDISGYWKLSGTSLFPRENNWNVGIGTDRPSTKLTIDFGNEVIPGVNANGIALIGNNNPGIIAARGAQELFTIGGVTSAAAYTIDSQYGDGVFASPGRILFGTGVVGSPPNAPTRMTITSNGNVGIGTTNPEPEGWPLAVRLGVEGGAIRSNSNRIYLTGGDSMGMFWINRGPDEGGSPLVNPGGDNVIGWNSAPGFSGREVIVMGRTVIGQPSPAWARQDLLVTGDADISGRVTIRGGNPGVGKVLTSDDATGVASWKPSSGAIKSASGMLSLPPQEPLTNDPRTINVSFTPVGAICSPARDTYTGGWSHTWCFANSISLGSNSVTFNNMGCHRPVGSGTCEINYMIIGY